MQSALHYSRNLNRILGLKTSHLFVLKYGTSSRSSSDGQSGSVKKLQNLPKITVILDKQKHVMTLAEAQKLAERRKLSLVVEEQNSRTKYPIYKLINVSEMISKDNDVPTTADNIKSAQKSEKQLTIGSRISDHDLSSRLKNISKWLGKQHEVRILIQCSADDISNGDKIFKSIEQSINNPNVIGKVIQKHTKGSAIKFTIIPIVSTTAK